MEENGKTAINRGTLYLEKAAGEPRQRILPKLNALNSKWSASDWKLKDAPVLSEQRLLFIQ